MHKYLNMKIEKSLLFKTIQWLGPTGLSFFSHLKGLTGEVSPVLNLNFKRKGLPAHPVHFREGMTIRNWMREQEECKDWSTDDFDNHWITLIEEAIKK